MTGDPSRYEIMRTDPTNWTFCIIYRCVEDPRLVVRNLAPFGWTWNFAHLRVWPVILLAIVVFLGPVYLAARLGVASIALLAVIAAGSLIILMAIASRLARDPAD